ADPSGSKIKKVPGEAPTVRLEHNPDVLASLVAARAPGQLVIGFAAETGDDAGDVLAHGADKARRKGADLLVVNPVGVGVGF
ncbi:MAG TPA: phosphopantothenoylcysteine decarboxylase, partial [Actinotalea sp.]|nr:phosphopantothenoylcysteine decarboxylase [Actinotalea sp.]